MVEHLLAKEKAAGSNPVFRSTLITRPGEHSSGLFVWASVAPLVELDSRSARLSVRIGGNDGCRPVMESVPALIHLRDDAVGGVFRDLPLLVGE